MRYFSESIGVGDEMGKFMSDTIMYFIEQHNLWRITVSRYTLIATVVVGCRSYCIFRPTYIEVAETPQYSTM